MQLKAHLTGNYFVTGTDTEIGKTTITAQLVKAIAEQGKSVYAIKPVTAGLEVDEKGNRYSDDARRINHHANIKLPMDALAPIRLTTPCSPHIAAKIDNMTLTTGDIVKTIQQTISDYPANVVLVEGAGGWLAPISATETLADVAIALGSPVIVVVGMKLGSLNHALLTLQAIWQTGLEIAMVIFNQLSDDTPYLTEQIEWLSQRILSDAKDFQTSSPMLMQYAFQPK